MLFLLLLLDEVGLKDKTVLKGRITEEKDDAVTIETYDRGPVTVKRVDVKAIKKGASKLDAYDKKSAATADEHAELGAWCARQGLTWRAQRHLEKAIELEPGHKAARRAMQTYFPVRAVEIKLKVAVKPDAGKAYLDGLVSRFEEAADAWWRCTEGQMYLSTIHIVDKSDEGDVVIHNLDSPKWLPGQEYGRVEGGTTIYLGGEFPVVTFCHEMGHLFFDLPEEYVKPECGACVMNPWIGEFKFCDAKNHTGAGEDCWARILKRQPNWEHPHKFGKRPDVKVTYENR